MGALARAKDDKNTAILNLKQKILEISDFTFVVVSISVVANACMNLTQFHINFTPRQQDSADIILLKHWSQI